LVSLTSVLLQFFYLNKPFIAPINSGCRLEVILFDSHR
jgi:hypothetical protein